MKQSLLGVYPLGYENIDVFLMPHSTGGEFYLCPSAIDRARIKIGLDYHTWSEVVAVTLHEALEFALTRKDLRFSQTSKLMQDSGDYLFVMTHPQFHQACCHVAEFLASALPDLAKAYSKAKKAKGS